MAISFYDIFPWCAGTEDGSCIMDQYSRYVVVAILSLLGTYFLVDGKTSSLPVMNPRKRFELSNQRRLNEFLLHSYDTFLEAKASFLGKPYKLFTAEGECVILPPQFLNELRNNPNLEFFQCFREVRCAIVAMLYPGADDYV